MLYWKTDIRKQETFPTFWFGSAPPMLLSGESKFEMHCVLIWMNYKQPRFRFLLSPLLLPCVKSIEISKVNSLVPLLPPTEGKGSGNWPWTIRESRSRNALLLRLFSVQQQLSESKESRKFESTPLVMESRVSRTAHLYSAHFFATYPEDMVAYLT